MKQPKAQITEYICALCANDAPAFLTMDFAAFREHAMSTHGLTPDHVRGLRGRTEIFMDGQAGSARQIARFRDEAGMDVCIRVWSSGVFASGDRDTVADIDAYEESTKKWLAERDATKAQP